MKLVEPVVIKLAETRADWEGVRELLKHFNVSQETLTIFSRKWYAHSAETLIETAGRMCYKSFEPGLNPNVTKIRDESKDYFENILKKGDGSILEHVQVSFAFLNVSRIFTHELVRHRVGIAISQESLRYVRPNELGLWIPSGLDEKQEVKLQQAFYAAEKAYDDIERTVDWDKLSFDKKKVLTSAFRRLLPDGMATNIVWSANLRALRHIIDMRTDPAAEIEIRTVFDKVALICKDDYPFVFQDFERKELPDGTGSWKPILRSKV